MTVEIRILGPIEASRDGVRVDVRGDRQRTLLALLALTPGHARPMDRIVDAMWAEAELPADPRPAIHTCASRVRGVLGEEVIVSTGGAYALAVSPLAVDAHKFELLVDRAAEMNRTLTERIVMLREALALWRGPALDGLADREWSRPDALRLDERRAFAEDLLAEALLEAGRADESVASLEAAASRQPLRERTHLLLMTALHAVGRQGEALRVFQNYRRRLATDLGLDPGESIAELDRHIANGDGVTDEVAPRGLPPARGYRLLERIGDGAFAVVYRGLQPAVGREVAIKVVREELANRPEFIRRFEAEAHLVARLEHPHIVPLYDYWREPYAAWLVMRLFRGGTLEDRIAERPLALDDVVRIATQIGGALEAAHRAGVVHRDVKPANVFLDADGNAFLGDFGIAYADEVPHDALDSLSVGSPAYASPEQLRREPVGPPADIHGLAITVYECLAGHRPFGDAPTEAELLRRQLSNPMPNVRAVRADVPAAVDDVLRRATAKRPLDRYSTVTEFVTELTAAATGTASRPARRGTATAMGGELRNPYKGLLAFQEADAADFFGRVRLVDRLVERMGGSGPAARFVVLVGPSGAGKSSVVRAGLLPALRAGRVPSSDSWFVTTMLPGSDPFEELEAALARVAGTSVGGLAELMASDRRGIGRAVKQVLPDETSELVLVLDQFEELFTLCPDPVLRQRFATGLVAAVGDARSRLRVVTTLRADFYDLPLRIPELATIVEQGTVVLTPLAADELEQAITEPALGASSVIEPGLVARIVADVVDQPGALPLLQYALTELFDRRASGVMTAAAYDELGGLSGALGQRAEAIHAGLDDHERVIARRLFTRLATPGEGTTDTRRRALRSELGSDPAIDRVIAAFGQARLLAFDHDPVTREPTVEVAHEALLREWQRLRGWLDDDRNGLRVHRHLTLTAAGWEASGRDPGELYRGGRLETASAWARDHDGDLNEREAAFLERSESAHLAAIGAEARERRRLHRLLAAVACVAVVALITSVLAVGARRRAQDNERAAASAAAEADAQRTEAVLQRATASAQRDAAGTAKADAEAAQAQAERVLHDAETARMAALAPAIADTDLSLALLLAAEARSRGETPETLGGLLDTMHAAGNVLRIVPDDGPLGVPFKIAPLGDDRLVTVHPSDRLVVRDLTTLEPIDTFTVSDPRPFFPGPLKFEVPAIADGFAVWPGGSHAYVVDLTTGEERALPGGPPSGVDVDASTGRVVVVDEVGGLALFDTPDSTAPRWRTNGDGIRTVSDAIDAGLLSGVGVDPGTVLRSFARFSLDGSSVFVARGWGVRQYRVDDGTLVDEWSHTSVLAGLGQVIEVVDTTRLAISTYSDLWILDVTNGELSAAIDADRFEVGQALHNPVAVGDGRLVVPTTAGTYYVIDRNGAVSSSPVSSRVGLGGGAGLLHSGTVLMSGDAGYAEHAVDGRTLLRTVLPGTDWATGVWPAFDGAKLTVHHRPSGATQFDRAQEWACGTGAEDCTIVDDVLADPAAPDSMPVAYWADPMADVRVEWHPDLTSVTTIDGDLIGEVPSPEHVRRTFVPEHHGWIAFFDTGLRHLDVWSLPHGDRLAQVDFDGIWRFMTGSPDGRTLLFSDIFTGDVQVLNTSTWALVPAATEAIGPAIWVAFDQQGDRMVTVTPTGEVTLRDGRTYHLIRVLGGDGCCVATSAFSEDGRLLLVSLAHSVQLWDTETGRPIGSPQRSEWADINLVPGKTPFLPDVVPGQGVTIWRYEVDTWADLACKAAGRNMTEQEWELYGPVDEEYHATCSQWPLPLDGSLTEPAA